MGSGCYTWERKCLAPQNPCSQAALSQSCPDTQFWFWILGGALAVALLVGGKR
jgi:hypothetical protein